MWVVPSRGRPHLVKRLFDVGIREKGVLVLDVDDAAKYERVRLPFGWSTLVLPRMYLGPKLNAAFNAFPDEPWYGVLNDDHLPVTLGWEGKVVNAAGLRSIAWPDDNYGKRISSHVMGGDLARELGWTMCPRLAHYYLDDVHERIAECVGGVFVGDVMVSHEHVNAGRAPMDRTYAERPSPENDRIAYEKWLSDEWPGIRDRLAAKGYKPPSEEALNVANNIRPAQDGGRSVA